MSNLGGAVVLICDMIEENIEEYKNKGQNYFEYLADHFLNLQENGSGDAAGQNQLDPNFFFSDNFNELSIFVVNW